MGSKVYCVVGPCCMRCRQTQKWSLLGWTRPRWWGERTGGRRPPWQEAHHWWSWCLAVNHRRKQSTFQRVLKKTRIHCCSFNKTHHAPAGFSFLHTNVLKETGKALIQPEVIPPIHGHNVPKPLEKTTDMSFNKGSYIVFTLFSGAGLDMCWWGGQSGSQTQIRVAHLNHF